MKSVVRDLKHPHDYGSWEGTADRDRFGRGILSGKLVKGSYRPSVLDINSGRANLRPNALMKKLY